MIDQILSKYRHWHYKNTAILILSLALFFVFADSPIIRETINKIGNLGYIGAFLAGIFFVSIFTVAPAAVVIYDLAAKLNPFEVAIFAGAGGVVGDYLIFRFLKNKVFGELAPLLKEAKGLRKISHLFRTPHFSWLMPIIGASLIASPMPDEVGVGMLGLSRIKNWQFLLITFLLNAVGIFIIVALAKIT